jgi:DNA-binding IclR family transcriptional regulator
MRAGLIEQSEGDRRYYLGEEAYVLGSLASRRFGLLQLAMGSLQRLSKATEDTSFLSVRRGTFAICLYREEGSYPIRTHALQAGFQHPLGAGAGSLAILAALPDEEVAAILRENAKVLAEQYPLLPAERIRKDVAVTRARGFALNPGLIVTNSWGVGKAILSPDRRPAGALSIAAIDSRLQKARQTELAGYLAREVTIIEQKLTDMFRGKEAPAANSSRKNQR